MGTAYFHHDSTQVFVDVLAIVGICPSSGVYEPEAGDKVANLECGDHFGTGRVDLFAMWSVGLFVFDYGLLCGGGSPSSSGSLHCGALCLCQRVRDVLVLWLFELCQLQCG